MSIHSISFPYELPNEAIEKGEYRNEMIFIEHKVNENIISHVEKREYKNENIIFYVQLNHMLRSLHRVFLWRQQNHKIFT